MIKLKSRNIFLILGASMCVTVASVLTYALSMNNSSNGIKLSSAINSVSTSIWGIESKNRDYLDSFYAASAQQSENKNQNFSYNLQCDIAVSNGFEGLSTDEERTLYNKMKLYCDRISNKLSKDGYEIIPITVTGKCISSAQIKKVFYAFSNDNPEIFWISKVFKYGYYNGSNIVTLHSLFSKEEKRKAVEEFNDKVLEIISKVPKYASDYEKELFLHDYIIDNCKYSKKAPHLFSAYGCLVDGEAVCEGYSRAAQILFSRVGIESRFVSGLMDGGMHSWNMIKVNGYWYQLDVTGDAGGECQRYNYFNVDDDTIKKDHIISEQLSASQEWPQDKVYNFKLPACNSMRENYFEKNAIKISSEIDLSKITNKIVEIAKNGSNMLYIKINKVVNIDKIKNKLMSGKIFEYIIKANRILNGKIKVSSSRILHSTCKPQNVIIVKLECSDQNAGGR